MLYWSNKRFTLLSFGMNRFKLEVEKIADEFGDRAYVEGAVPLPEGTKLYNGDSVIVEDVDFEFSEDEQKTGNLLLGAYKVTVIGVGEDEPKNNAKKT